MSLRPDETDLTGRWLSQRDRVVPDDTAQRIDQLVRDDLRWLADSPDGWDRLYRDRSDSRLWELTYPQSGWQGGGPPRLTCITTEAAAAKYGDFSRRDRWSPGPGSASA